MLICNEFNNFFVNIGPELAQNIKQDNLRLFYHSYIIDILKLFLKAVDGLEIKSVVLSCKCRSSLDADNVSMLIKQQTIYFILELLIHIFNLSFKNGVFLNSMKLAEIIPIYIKGKG